LNLKELLLRQKHNEKIAISCASKSITYEAWNIESQKISLQINENIQTCSKCIAVFLPNSIDYAVAFYGILFSNKIVIPIDIRSKPSEIRTIIEYCEVDCIITSDNYINELKAMSESYAYRLMIYCIENHRFIIFNQDKPCIDKTNINDIDDVAIMLHTSGTTSNPKRVMLTHNNLICNVESNIESLMLSEDDRTLIVLPMCFGYCNTAQFLTHVYLGASMVIYSGMFMPSKFFETLQNQKITNCTVVPTMLLMILEYRYKENYDINMLKYICFGGSKMPEHKLKLLINTFKNVGFVHTYGQTEASPRVTMLGPQFALSKIGSVGKPIPRVEVKVVDSTNNEVLQCVIGEIMVSGENVMKGYFKRPDLNEKIIENGWLHTGDLGYFDSDGFLYIVGRKKNMIISGGINIYPEEIEEVIMNHPNVKDVCVISEQHELLGEMPIARVVLRENVFTDLSNFCRKRLADYKIPFRFDFVDKIDKTYNGKVKRYEE